MEKKITAMILAILLTLCLAACGSGSAASVSADTASSPAAADVAEAPEMPEIPLTPGKATADVGDFTVTVPEGWLGSGDFDVDENGNYFIEPFYYILIKGGESAEDQFTKPAVSIFYSPSRGAQEQLEFNKNPTDEITDLDITIGGKKCPAFHSVMGGAVEGEDPFVMEYDNIFIPVTESSCFRVTMLTYTTSGGETGVSASDPDVIAIMESIQAK